MMYMYLLNPFKDKVLKPLRQPSPNFWLKIQTPFFYRRKIINEMDEIFQVGIF